MGFLLKIDQLINWAIENKQDMFNDPDFRSH